MELCLNRDAVLDRIDLCDEAVLGTHGPDCPVCEDQPPGAGRKAMQNAPALRIDARHVRPEREPERAGAVRETGPDRLAFEREATGDLAGSLVDPQKPGSEILSDPDRTGGRQKTCARRERQLQHTGDLFRGKVDAKETLSSAEQDPARASRGRNVRPRISDADARLEADSLDDPMRSRIDEVERARPQ